jgi:Fe-S oxidoreductase
MYIDNCLKYIVVENISNEAFRALWIEISLPKRSNIICGVIYRQHNSPESFLKYLEETIEKFSHSGKIIYIMGDININPLRFESCNYCMHRTS